MGNGELPLTCGGTPYSPKGTTRGRFPCLGSDGDNRRRERLRTGLVEGPSGLCRGWRRRNFTGIESHDAVFPYGRAAVFRCRCNLSRLASLRCRNVALKKDTEGKGNGRKRGGRPKRSQEKNNSDSHADDLSSSSAGFRLLSAVPSLSRREAGDPASVSRPAGGTHSHGVNP